MIQPSHLFVDDISLENNDHGNWKPHHESDPEVDLIPPDTDTAIIQPDPTIGNAYASFVDQMIDQAHSHSHTE